MTIHQNKRNNQQQHQHHRGEPLTDPPVRGVLRELSVEGSARLFEYQRSVSENTSQKKPMNDPLSALLELGESGKAV